MSPPSLPEHWGEGLDHQGTAFDCGAGCSLGCSNQAGPVRTLQEFLFFLSFILPLFLNLGEHAIAILLPQRERMHEKRAERKNY